MSYVLIKKEKIPSYRKKKRRLCIMRAYTDILLINAFFKQPETRDYEICIALMALEGGNLKRLFLKIIGYTN